MTQRIVFLRGLPGSGKSTLAKGLVAASGGTMVRTNKDDLRALLHDGKWSKEREAIVVAMRDAMIQQALKMNLSVVVDDTNFEEKHFAAIDAIAKRWNIPLEVEDFSHVPLKTCLERNKNRDRVIAGRDVPEEVIQRMWRQYVKPKMKAEPQDPSLPPCIICDIDGTIATMSGRGPFDWDKVGTDMPRQDVLRVVQDATLDEEMHALPARLIFLSGRDEACRDQTIHWLELQLCSEMDCWDLFMRPAGSMERDSVVKRRLYEDHIKGKYRVIGVFDDRKQVIRELWEPLGFTVFNVGSVDEEF